MRVGGGLKIFGAMKKNVHYQECELGYDRGAVIKSDVAYCGA